MKKLFFLFFLLIFLNACYVNERGLARNYYSDCKEYYDASGIYRKSCPKNFYYFPKKFVD